MNISENQIVARERRPWVSSATRDAIRHFAWGVGDNNPLWLDLDYGAASVWGSIVAPPCFLYAVDEATIAPGYPDHRRVYRSVDWTFYDVVRLGDELSAKAFLTGETTSANEIEQQGRADYHRADGALVARAETRCLRTAEPVLDVEDRPELRYSGDQLNEFERIIMDEARQGQTHRLWEEVRVGDSFGPLVKGPLSIMDVVAWSAATTGVAPESAALSEGGLHAQMATGPEQVAWIAQAVTDWMGDDAFLYRLSLEIDSCPPLGATTIITGEVAALTKEDGRPCAELSLTAASHQGQVTAQGRAVVLLPSAEFGPVRLPIDR